MESVKKRLICLCRLEEVMDFEIFLVVVEVEPNGTEQSSLNCFHFLCVTYSRRSFFEEEY
jgi:hypothetical protein